MSRDLHAARRAHADRMRPTPPRRAARRWLAAVLFIVAAAAALAAPARRPNVVFILTDNQGAWTLGCYGNREIRTPHIDALAAGGLRLTRALSSNPVCSPTRATFLTGLLPSQHGVHSFLDPKFMMGPQAYNTLAEFTSLGEILRAGKAARRDCCCCRRCGTGNARSHG